MQGKSEDLETSIFNCIYIVLDDFRKNWIWKDYHFKRAHNPKVTGSNPVPATNKKIKGLDEKSKPFFIA